VRLAQTVKAKTAEGRFTGLVMVAFPAVMFAITYVIDPKRGDVMLSTSTGRIFIGVAVFLMLLGSFLIKRITTVKV
jgi:tight adherence protein B